MNGEGRVLDYMKAHGSITSWDAITEYGMTRLSAVILRLRNKGYNIVTSNETKKNRFGETCTYARYSLLE